MLIAITVDDQYNELEGTGRIRHEENILYRSSLYRASTAFCAGFELVAIYYIEIYIGT